MIDKLNELISTWQGKSLEVSDPTNYAQCMDLAFAWCDKIGVSRDAIHHLYAYQVFTMPSDVTLQYFNFIPNTPNGVPPAGALVVFGTSVGPAGHICIATDKCTSNTLVSFDQNWDTKHFNAGTNSNGELIPICRIVTHTYDGVLGWLVLKSPPPVLEITDKTQIPLGLVGEVNYGSPELQALKSLLLAKDQYISSHPTLPTPSIPQYVLTPSSESTIPSVPENVPLSPPSVTLFSRIMDFFKWFVK